MIIIDVVQTAAVIQNVAAADNVVVVVAIIVVVCSDTVAAAAADAPRRRITRLLIAALVLCAVATQVADFATAVAALVPGGTIPRDVTTLVAIVTGHVHVPVALLRAVACQMSTLVAVVTARVIRGETAVTGNVAASVTAVAPVQILLAVTCKVSHLVAFVALLATSAAATTTASELTVPRSSWATTTSANVLAIAGIVSRPVTLEARISRHSVLLRIRSVPSTI